MPPVDVDDIRNELPALTIDSDSRPSEQQVEQYVDDTVKEVRALCEAEGGNWPTDPSSLAFEYVRRTVLEGVRWLTLRAVFALSTDAGTAGEVARSERAYQSRLQQIPKIVKAMAIQQPTQSTGSNSPAIGAPDFAPPFGQTFAEAAWQRYYDNQRMLPAPWPRSWY